MTALSQTVIENNTNSGDTLGACTLFAPPGLVSELHVGLTPIASGAGAKTLYVVLAPAPDAPDEGTTLIWTLEANPSFNGLTAVSILSAGTVTTSTLTLAGNALRDWLFTDDGVTQSLTYNGTVVLTHPSPALPSSTLFVNIRGEDPAARAFAIGSLTLTMPG